MNDTPLQWTIGLVGYGEVGRILAEDLRARGVENILTYDIKFGTADDAPLLAHAAQHGVRPVTGHAFLARAVDLVISAVTADQALAAAASLAPYLRSGGCFLDLNSASPGTKIKSAGLVEAAGARYVEGAVMTSLPPYRIRVPLLLGGPHAESLTPAFEALGFAPRGGDARLGIVSATKMCRSVMIKGLEAMVIESFTAARAYGVEDAVIASLQETFPAIDWEQQGAYFFQRVIEHGRRRGEEMREVAQTLREVGLDPWSATASAERDAWMAELGDAGVFGLRGAPGFARSADWRTEADRIIGMTRTKA